MGGLGIVIRLATSECRSPRATNEHCRRGSVSTAASTVLLAAKRATQAIFKLSRFPFDFGLGAPSSTPTDIYILYILYFPATTAITIGDYEHISLTATIHTSATVRSI